MAHDFTGTTAGTVENVGGTLRKLVSTSPHVWEAVGGAYGPGIRVQTFTANGTYTPSTGMRYCHIRGVAGGGGGGGVNGQASNGYTAGGGGAGEYGEVTLTADQVGTSQTVTIGGGGAGGVAGANDGANGTNTSVGTLLVLNHGKGGTGSTAYNTAGGAGGSGGTADFTVAGQNGSRGPAGGTSGTTIPAGGQGGDSQLGTGGVGGIAAITGSNNGENGAGYGAGGGGGQAWFTTGDSAGGNGAAGIVIITEFIGESYGDITGYVTVSNTAPNSSVSFHGNIWVEESTFDIYVYYDDGNSAQWVEVGSGAGFSIAGKTAMTDIITPSDQLLIYDDSAGDEYSIEATKVGAMHLLANGTASAVSSIDFDLRDYPGYHSYKIECSYVHVSSDGAVVKVRTSTTESPTALSFDSGVSDYGYYFLGYHSTVDDAFGQSDSADDGIDVWNGIGNVGQYEYGCGDITFVDVNETTHSPMIRWNSSYVLTDGSAYFNIVGTGWRLTTSYNITGAQLIVSTGTFDCKYRLYGVL